MFAAGKGGFLSKMAMNPENPKIIAAAVTLGAEGTPPNHVALSQNRGDSFTFHPMPTVDPISTLTFSADGRLLYANTVAYDNIDGNYVNTIYRCVVDKWECSSIGTPPTINFVQQIVVNPNKRHRIYIMATWDQSDFRFPDVHYYDGFKWKDITIDGSNLQNSGVGGAMSYISRRGINTIVVATSNGILVPNGRVGAKSHTEWKIMATGIPVVSVTDMVYDVKDDLLVLGTMGRGVWYVKQASRYTGKKCNLFSWLSGWVFREEDDDDTIIDDTILLPSTTDTTNNSNTTTNTNATTTNTTDNKNTRPSQEPRGPMKAKWAPKYVSEHTHPA